MDEVNCRLDKLMNQKHKNTKYLRKLKHLPQVVQQEATKVKIEKANLSVVTGKSFF